MRSRERHDPRIAELVAHLYDAVLDDAPWQGTAARIAHALGSTSAVLKLHGDGASVSLLECTENLVVPERERAWADEWHRKDLWVERSVAYGMSRIVTSDELVTPAEQRRSGFYQDWLRRLDIHHMLGAVFPVADGAVGVLGIHRPPAAGAYAQRERRRAGLVLPHLQRVLRLRQRLAAQSRLHTAALEALDRLDTGVLVMDGACRIIHASAMAQSLLRDNAALAVVGGRLWLRPPHLHDRLLSRVRAALDVAHGRLAKPAMALSVPRPGRMPLALEVAPLPPSIGALAKSRPYCLLFIRDPQAPIVVARLRELFGLTHTEGVVAAALGQGHSPQEIAASMDVGIATVRSHIKRLLAKTGTHRQAQAVTLLARSVSSNEPCPPQN